MTTFSDIEISGTGALEVITQTGSTDDHPALNVIRVANESGGTPGFVNNAGRFYSTAGTNNTNYEWSLLAQMDNYASAGQNCAFFAQNHKYGGGPSWAATFEASEITGASYGALVGMEVDIAANGADPQGVRVGIDVVGALPNGTGITGAALCGVRVGSQPENMVFATPFRVDAAYSGSAYFSSLRMPFAQTAGNSIGLFEGHVNCGNDDQLKIAVTRNAGNQNGWIGEDITITRIVDGSVISQIKFGGDGSISMTTNQGAGTMKLSSAGLVVNGVLK